jgi:hypothetical protein
MTEQELRALVREAIAKAAVGGAEAPPYGVTEAPPHGVSGHSSHAMFTLAPADPEGRCVIEPGVACNHCGYCKSYGH